MLETLLGSTTYRFVVLDVMRQGASVDDESQYLRIHVDFRQRKALSSFSGLLHQVSGSTNIRHAQVLSQSKCMSQSSDAGRTRI